MHCTRLTLAFALLVTLHVTRINADRSIDAERDPPDEAERNAARYNRRLLQYGIVSSDYAKQFNFSFKSPELAEAYNAMTARLPPSAPPPPSAVSPTPRKLSATPYYYTSSSSSGSIPVGGILAIVLSVITSLVTIVLCVKCCCRQPSAQPGQVPAGSTSQPPMVTPPAGVEMDAVRKAPIETAATPIPVCHPSTEDDSPWHCPVCTEDISHAKNWTLFPCGHGSCNGCYQNLLKEPKPGCPLCRLELTEPRPEGDEAHPISVVASTAVKSAATELPSVAEAAESLFDI